MSEKNICQNPKCCDNDTKDRWSKKLNAFQSRKAYFSINKIRLNYCKILCYFCTTSCANKWLDDHLESIIDHRGTIEKILEKKIRA